MGLSVSNIVVLVVDDEPLIRMYAVDAMEDAGFHVIEADSGPEALAVLGDHPEITSLFTDIQMPGAFDGLTLARKVHELRPDVQLVSHPGMSGRRPPKYRMTANSLPSPTTEWPSLASSAVR